MFYLCRTKIVTFTVKLDDVNQEELLQETKKPRKPSKQGEKKQKRPQKEQKSEETSQQQEDVKEEGKS